MAALPPNADTAERPAMSARRPLCVKSGDDRQHPDKDAVLDKTTCTRVLQFENVR